MKNISLIIMVNLLLVLHSTAFCQNKPQLNHIAHYVVNLKTSTDFYMNIIGLDSIAEPFHDGKHTWLSIGYKTHLHLIQGAKQPVLEDKNIHVCFTVASVAAFVKVLEQNKIPYENWAGDKNTVTKRVDGVEQIYFKDPDGYWIEINDAKG